MLRTKRRVWGYGAGLWSLVFSAAHFYWAAGGRTGFGPQTAAADEALEETWFARYNLVAALLGIAGTVVALALGRGAGAGFRWMNAAAWIACILLTARGVLGVALLTVGTLRGVPLSDQGPPLLLVVEPWFVLGGILFGLVAWSARRERTRAPTQ